MKGAHVDDVELAYEVSGEGDPLLLVHGANLADGMLPFARDPALNRVVRPIRYHRRGYGRSTGGPVVTVGRQAEDALGLLDALGIERAWVCGYSYGGTIALEIAARSPERLLGLALLEPIIVAVPSAEEFMKASAPIYERYAAGDAAHAVTDTFESLGGSRWRELVEAAAPGGVYQAIEDADLFFTGEGPSLADWAYVDSGSVNCPVASFRGLESGPFFEQGRERLHEWFPQCIDIDIEDSTHFLHIQQPERVVSALARFVSSSAPISETR